MKVKTCKWLFLKSNTSNNNNWLILLDRITYVFVVTRAVVSSPSTSPLDRQKNYNFGRALANRQLPNPNTLVRNCSPYAMMVVTIVSHVGVHIVRTLKKKSVIKGATWYGKVLATSLKQIQVFSVAGLRHRSLNKANLWHHSSHSYQLGCFVGNMQNFFSL